MNVTVLRHVVCELDGPKLAELGLGDRHSINQRRVLSERTQADRRLRIIEQGLLPRCNRGSIFTHQVRHRDPQGLSHLAEGIRGKAAISRLDAR